MIALDKYKAFMRAHSLTAQEMLALLEKYTAIHACRCGSPGCTSHHLCHTSA